MKKIIILLIVFSMLMPSGFASELEKTYPERDGENDLLISDQLQIDLEDFMTMEIFTAAAVQIQEGKTATVSEIITESAVERFGTIARLQVWSNNEKLIDQPLLNASIPTSNLKPGVYELVVQFASSEKKLPFKVTAKKSGGSGGAPFIPVPSAEEAPMGFDEALAAISDGTDASWISFWQVFLKELSESEDTERVESMLMEVFNHETFQTKLTNQGMAASKATLLLAQASIDQISKLWAETSKDKNLDLTAIEALANLQKQVSDTLGHSRLKFNFRVVLTEQKDMFDLTPDALTALMDNQIMLQIDAKNWTIGLDPAECKAGSQIAYEIKKQEGTIAVIELSTDLDEETHVNLGYDLVNFNGEKNHLRMETYDKKTASWKKVKSWILNDSLLADVDGSGQYRIITKTSSFDDIQGHWAEDIINRMNSRGYIKGISATKFEPDAIINRAEAVTMLMNAVQKKAVMDIDFSDVRKTDWFYNPVNLAAQIGIVQGDGAGKFDPYQEVTREDFVLMLARLYKIQTGEMLESDVRVYYDMGKASGYAKKAINGAADAKVITGVEGGYFRPKDPATRADAISMIERVVNLIWQ